MCGRFSRFGAGIGPGAYIFTDMKSKYVPILVALAIPLAAVAVALSLVYAKKRTVSGLEDFSYAAYIGAPKNLAGNKYLLKCQPDRQLADLESRGRLVSVRTADGMSKLAVLVPSNLDVNISANRRYAMVVKIDPAGRVIAESVEKY